jgi:hypothetical protein
MDMQPGEHIGSTYRLNPLYNEKPPTEQYDEWGFLKFPDRLSAYLPIIIPFDQLLVKSGKADEIKNQKIIEYYMFRDFSTFLSRP